MAPNITTTTSGSGCPINTNKSQPTHPTPFTLAAKPSTITMPSKTTTNSPKSHPTPFTLAAKSSTSASSTTLSCDPIHSCLSETKAHNDGDGPFAVDIPVHQPTNR
eukprot:579862_1